jgi:glycine/D-amino acid oxidase-like deaminating enzyme
VKVAVIGAGVVGASVSLRLAQRGVQVVVLESSQPGEGSSGASFAWVNASTREPHAYFRLCGAAMAEYESLRRECDDPPWLSVSGHLHWATDAAAMARLADRAARLAAWNYPSAVIEAHEAVRRFEPRVVFPAPDHPVLWTPTEGWVDGPAMARHLIALATRAGATIRLGRAVTAIGTVAGHVRSVAVAGGEVYDVDAVVNAAGPSADHVASLVGRALPLSPSPGLVLRVDAPGPPVTRALHAPAVEIRPDGRDRILLHSRDVDARLDGSGFATDADMGELLRLARDVVPSLSASGGCDARIGWRPLPRDGFPSIGGIAPIPGYFEAVTHSGVTLAPLIGRVVAHEVVTGEVDELAEPYRPDRPGLAAASP